MLTRRSLLAAASATASLPLLGGWKKIPVGLEMFSVRDDLRKDLLGTVRAVAKLGYEGLEFFSPYFDWSFDQAKEVRKVMDDSGIRCFSTHNSAKSFTPENIGKATELNQILGSKLIVMASAGRVENLDGWKGVADQLAKASEKLKPAGMASGFHNHALEFKPLEGTRPVEVLAKNTPREVVMQLDVGTCIQAGSDPVAWVEANPGRIRSMHLKDWSPDEGKGYKVLFGEGAAPWKKLMEAAEKSGGIEHYLIEQEGSAFPPLETVEKCLANFKKLRKS